MTELEKPADIAKIRQAHWCGTASTYQVEQCSSCDNRVYFLQSRSYLVPLAELPERPDSEVKDPLFVVHERTYLCVDCGRPFGQALLKPTDRVQEIPEDVFATEAEPEHLAQDYLDKLEAHSRTVAEITGSEDEVGRIYRTVGLDFTLYLHGEFWRDLRKWGEAGDYLGLFLQRQSDHTYWPLKTFSLTTEMEPQEFLEANPEEECPECSGQLVTDAQEYVRLAESSPCHRCGAPLGEHRPEEVFE